VHAKRLVYFYYFYFYALASKEIKTNENDFETIQDINYVIEILGFI